MEKFPAESSHSFLVLIPCKPQRLMLLQTHARGRSAPMLASSLQCFRELVDW